MSRAQAYRYVNAAWSEIRQDIGGPNTEKVDYIVWVLHTLQAFAGDAGPLGQLPSVLFVSFQFCLACQTPTLRAPITFGRSNL